MSKLIFNNSELVNLIKANVSMPDNIREFDVDAENNIFIKIKLPMMMSADIILEFDKFSDGIIFFKLKPNCSISLVAKNLSSILNFNHKSDYFEINSDSINIHLDKFLSDQIGDKIKGLNINSIRYENNNFVCEF
ncbi:MAG TPA: hypothetical protein PKY81_07330 [bacterium]|nr:hypothetical protein [bacterium]